MFRDSTAHGPSPSHPSTRGTTGIFLYASRKPIKPFVTAVTCAALHPVHRASCTSKIILSMHWTCFSFQCTQKIRKKLVQLRRGRPQSECKSRAAFPVSTSSKSRLETSSPPFNSTSHFLAPATLHFANTSKPLSIRRSLSSCLLKHGMLELKLFLMCSRLAVSLTAHASPAHLSSGFLRAWSKIGPFERSSSRCGQPMFWSHAHVEK